jgi:hypothetical protein
LVFNKYQMFSFDAIVQFVMELTPFGAF